MRGAGSQEGKERGPWRESLAQSLALLCSLEVMIGGPVQPLDPIPPPSNAVILLPIHLCQDPKLVSNTSQGAACAACVTSANVLDPYACKTCMAATSNDVNRGKCFTCVTTPAPNHGSNHAWGCGQCAQFSNTAVQDYCFMCLKADRLDPCECTRPRCDGRQGQYSASAT